MTLILTVKPAQKSIATRNDLFPNIAG